MPFSDDQGEQPPSLDPDEKLITKSLYLLSTDLLLEVSDDLLKALG